MATSRNTKPTKGEWSSTTVASFKEGSSTWKAQVSTSPDGKKFIGVRQHITKADGTEIVGKSGITFLQTDDSASKLQALGNLFLDLAKAKSKKLAAKDVEQEDVAPKKVYLVKLGLRYVPPADKDKLVGRKEHARHFPTKAKAQLFCDKAEYDDDDYKIVPYTPVAAEEQDD